MVTIVQTESAWVIELTQAEVEEALIAKANEGRSGADQLALPTGGDAGDEYWFKFPAQDGDTGFGSALPLTGPVVISTRDFTPGG